MGRKYYKIFGRCSMNQKHFNFLVFASVVLAFLLGVPWLFGVSVLPFVGNFLTYVGLVLGAGVVLPIFLGFLWRYFAVQAADDKFGHPRENMPDSLHFWFGIISALFLAFVWEGTLLPLISKAYALNTWAWDWIQFRTIYEGHTSWGWIVVVAIMFAIGYLYGHITDYDKYRKYPKSR